MDLYGLFNTAVRRMLIARGVEDHTEPIDGTMLHWYRIPGEGKGPPVVLLHGLGSNAHAFFRIFFPLAKHFSEIWAPDLPGNGFSPLPAKGPLELEQNVKLLAAFLEQKVKRKAWLIGTSLGGGMSFYLAHHAPQLLLGLGLIAPAGAKWSDARFAETLKTFDLKDDAAAKSLARRLYDRPPWAMVLLAPRLFKSIYGSAAVRAALQEAKPSDAISEAMLEGLTLPTLLIWGKSEKLLPYESIEYFRAHLPKTAEVHEVERFGHVPQVERPRALVALLLDFARRQGWVS